MPIKQLDTASEMDSNAAKTIFQVSVGQRAELARLHEQVQS